MKNKNTLLVLGIAVLLVIVVGTTFAFFTAQNAGRETIGAEVNTTTGDTSTFLVSGDLSFTADQETFSVTSGDKSTTATGRVVFRAGSENESGSDLCYTVKLNVNSNNFKYTSQNAFHFKPEFCVDNPEACTNYPNYCAENPRESKYCTRDSELVLQAKYGDVTSYTTVAPSLDITSNSLHEYANNIGTVPYVTIPVASANNETGYVGRSSAISGYDVTTNTNTFYIPYQAGNNIYKIHAGAGETVEQDWVFKLNFINYEWDQAEVSNPNNNNNKTFDAQVVFESTTCPTYAYWNNNFVSTEFVATSMPNDETKTATEGRTYGSRELLAEAYDAAYTGSKPNEYHFSDRPVYIKTTLNNVPATGHEVCLYYNNHEFCYGPNYWTGTIGTKSSATAYETKAKLQADMETALGTTATSCNFNELGAYCFFNNFFCTADYDGSVRCGSNSQNSFNCGMYGNGHAYCYGN